MKSPVSRRFAAQPALRGIPAACAALLLAGSPWARAQSTPPGADAVAPDVIVVTGSREPMPANQVAGDVVVIDAERIRESTADSVEDLLRREAGLQVSRNGGPGANASVFIRGAGSGNTLVLVDGVRIGSATLGLVELESLSLAAIDHIEVLRGPGSSLYGADGAGGVVQIFTRRGEGPPQAVLRAAIGSYGAREASAQASGRFGELDLAGSVSHEQLDGVSALRPGDQFNNYNPDKDGARRTTAQAQIGYRPAAGHRIGLGVWDSRLDAQYDASQYLAPDFNQDNTPDFRNRLDSRVTALEHRGEWSPAWTTTLRASAQESDLHSGGTQIERFRTRREQLEAQASWRFQPDQRLTLALDTLHERAQSSAFFNDVKRDNDAAVLAYAGAIGPVQAQAEWRHDHSSVFGDVDTGRLGGSLAVARGWRVRALAGSSYRAPSFNDLYYPGYGVAAIRPERGRSVELGLEGHGAEHEFSVTAWRNQARDLIAYESDRSFCPADPSYDFGCARNVGRARLQGLSLAGGARWGGLGLRGTLDFLDAKDADTGARLVRRAAYQASLAADYRTGDWTLGAAALTLGQRPDGGIELPAQTTLDLKAAWRFSRAWTLETKLINATDADTTPSRDYQGLGRQAWIGLRYEPTSP